MKTYEPIPAFLDHKNCQNHSNFMLSCEFTKKEDRDLLSEVLSRYIETDKIAQEK